MRKMARRRPREFEILDVTSEVIRDYNAPSSLLESEDDDADARPMGRFVSVDSITDVNARIQVAQYRQTQAQMRDLQAWGT